MNTRLPQISVNLRLFRLEICYLLGFDIMKNDGIYSNSFTEIESQGRHYVEVMIEDVLTNSEIHRTYEIQLPTEKDTGKFWDKPKKPNLQLSVKFKSHMESYKSLTLLHFFRR